MTSDPQSRDDNSTHQPPANPHRLQLQEVQLVDAARDVHFRPGLNIIQGNITTGKTTFVRLLRALLGTMPDDLPPEVNFVSAIRGRVFLGDDAWILYRPRTSSSHALVDVVEEIFTAERGPVVLRLPVSGVDQTYSIFLLSSLSMPAVSVPTARMRPTGSLSPVTMTDWLGYCIIPGDELDTQVFGHQHPFRDIKRRWVFELAYGYYDPEVARSAALMRSIELRLESFDREAAVREKFLAGTPFADESALVRQLEDRRDQLEALRLRRMGLSTDVSQVPEVRRIREALLSARTRRSDISNQATFLSAQISDLKDLCRQLSSQTDRLTRAIVADEWLVDFDFIVCPRCGSDVDSNRDGHELCYLCRQVPQPTLSRDQLLAEQSRISSQIDETRSVIQLREESHKQLEEESRNLDRHIPGLADTLNELTGAFVSDNASMLEQLAAGQARIEADISRLAEYQTLLDRHAHQIEARSKLEVEYQEISAEVEARELRKVDADANVHALEQRMLEYLRELHVPELGRRLSVSINRKTFMPVVSGRTFDRLSSQGLKTLVNVAHALAHHTVAIDRNLPMPGLLILDGLSANVGSEGFDQARVNDMYRLLLREAITYADRLQIVAVDNELPRRMFLELSNYIVLTLTQADRLIRIPAGG
jgi:hypothetical protein